MKRKLGKADLEKLDVEQLKTLHDEVTTHRRWLKQRITNMEEVIREMTNEKDKMVSLAAMIWREVNWREPKGE